MNRDIIGSDTFSYFTYYGYRIGKLIQRQARKREIIFPDIYVYI